jgi:hypothetical protein
MLFLITFIYNYYYFQIVDLIYDLVLLRISYYALMAYLAEVG